MIKKSIKFIGKSLSQSKAQVKKEIGKSRSNKREDRIIVQKIRREERLKNLRKLTLAKEKMRYESQMSRIRLRKTAPKAISKFLKKQAAKGGGAKALVKPPKLKLKRISKLKMKKYKRKKRR